MGDILTQIAEAIGDALMELLTNYFGGGVLGDVYQFGLNFWTLMVNGILTMLTTSPQNFNQSAWTIVTGIFNGVQGIASSLLAIAFLVGLLRSSLNVHDMRRPEVIFVILIRFILVKIVIENSLPLLKLIMDIGTELVSLAISGAGGVTSIGVVSGDVSSIFDASLLADWDFMLWVATIITVLVLVAVGIATILTVYGRFFKIYVLAALSPIPLAALGGEPSQRIAFGYLKSFAGACLEGAAIAAACIIYTALASSVSDMLLTDNLLLQIGSSLTHAQIYLLYLSTILQAIMLLGMVRGADNLVQKYIGL